LGEAGPPWWNERDGRACVTTNTFSRGLDVSMAYQAGIPRDFNPIMIRKLASN
jgi:hypothetical protein